MLRRGTSWLPLWLPSLARAHPCMLSQALVVNLTHLPFLAKVDEEAARLAPTAAGSASSYPAAGGAAPTTQTTGKKTWFGRNKMPDAAPATAGPLGSGNPAAAASEPVGSAPASNGTGHAGWFGGQQQGDKVPCSQCRFACC